MILSSNNFTQNQFIEDEEKQIKSPLLSSFNNLFYYEYVGDSFMAIAPEKQLNAKGNPTKEPCNNYIKYYLSATGTNCWYGVKSKKTVTGPIVSENEIFTTPKYNYTTEDINKWFDWLNKQIMLNNGSILGGSSAMVVNDTTTTGNAVFYLPHDKDFMSKYFTSFPSQNILMPFKIENGLIEGMFKPVKGEIINSYSNLSYFLSSYPTSDRSYYVNPTEVLLISKGFDDDDIRNEASLNNLDNLDNKPYSCNFWDTSYFNDLNLPRSLNDNYTYYKPLLGQPIYCISWSKIKNCRSGFEGNKKVLVESDSWAVTIVKMEAGFLTK